MRLYFQYFLLYTYLIFFSFFEAMEKRKKIKMFPVGIKNIFYFKMMRLGLVPEGLNVTWLTPISV